MPSHTNFKPQLTQNINWFFRVAHLKIIAIISFISILAGVVAGFNWLGVGADFYNYQDYFHAISFYIVFGCGVE